MGRKTLQTPYIFYGMSEVERRAMVGTYFFASDSGKMLYFPVELSGCFNYGVAQGLIFITEIYRHYSVAADKNGARRNVFRVGAFSPDDLDLDLDFEHRECWLRQDVISYIKKMPKKGVTYMGVLESIRDHFKAGQIHR